MKLSDEESVFFETVKEKSSVAKSSKHRKGCRKSSGFVSDFGLSRFEKESRETMSINYNLPMSWAQFKSISDDSKKEYISFIIGRYNPRNKDVAAMFGIKQNVLSGFLANHGLSGVFKRKLTIHENEFCMWKAYVAGRGDEYYKAYINGDTTTMLNIQHDITDDNKPLDIESLRRPVVDFSENEVCEEPVYSDCENSFTFDFNDMIDIDSVTRVIKTLVDNGKITSLNIIGTYVGRK